MDSPHEGAKDLSVDAADDWTQMVVVNRSIAHSHHVRCCERDWLEPLFAHLLPPGEEGV